jgi:hypothetical protein
MTDKPMTKPITLTTPACIYTVMYEEQEFLWAFVYSAHLTLDGAKKTLKDLMAERPGWSYGHNMADPEQLIYNPTGSEMYYINEEELHE